MIKRFIDRLLDTLITILLGAMALVVSVNVFCRFLLKFSFHWADELAMILFVWLTFLGAAIAVRDNTHYVLNLLTPRLKGNVRKYLVVLQRILLLAAILILLVTGTIVTWRISDWLMPATEMSRSFVYGACPVGAVFMLYYAIELMVRKEITNNKIRV